MKKSLVASLWCAAGIALALPGAASAGVMSGAAADIKMNTGTVELVGHRDRDRH